MRFGSLFAGVGGFDLGLQRAGMTPTWSVEIDRQCRDVLRRHWPNVPHYEDVHDVGVFEDGGRLRGPDDECGQQSVLSCQSDERQADGGIRRDRHGTGTRRAVEPVDLICGGFPCQDYSVAGKRGGLAGDRGALWWEMHRIIAECRPTWVVGENVPGLLSSNGGRDFLTIIDSLVQLGYGVTWATLDSQYFGVAQRRRRLFVVGHSGGVPRPEILALSEGLYGHPAPSREAGEGVAPILEIGARTSGDGYRDGDGIGVPGDPMYILQARHQHGVAHTLRAEYDASGTGRGTPIVAFNQERGLAPHGTLEPSEVCPEITMSEHKGQTVCMTAIPRRLTPRECERLQSFPDDWTAKGLREDGTEYQMADGPRYRQMGNAVTVNVIEWIGRRIMAGEDVGLPLGWDESTLCL